jgi:fatty acid desaturase
MQAKRLGKQQNSRELLDRLRPLRKLDNVTNLIYLAADYLSLAIIIGAAVAFFELRAGWGLSWMWTVPAAAFAIVLVGALQHRLAGLGHEAAHYILLNNRVANELISDLLCMFPIFAVTHQYRLVHMAHHQYTNDWRRDPDLTNIGKSKLMDQFPMTRARFVYNYYVRFFLPHVLLRYLLDVLYLSALGRGVSPYLEGAGGDRSDSGARTVRWTSVLGALYVAGLVAVMVVANRRGAGVWDLTALAGIAFGLAALVVVRLPSSAFFQAPLKPIYSTKVTNVLRLAYYTGLVASFAVLRAVTGRNWGGYFALLWVVPLLTTFAYFMLLRDVYQHANADEGKLTNSRVFFCDPFTRWAVFVYGMDMHTPHHMFPAIPHYNLPKAHRLLQQYSAEYSRYVIECHGTFRNRVGKPTILDVMYDPTREPDLADQAAGA